MNLLNLLLLLGLTLAPGALSSASFRGPGQPPPLPGRGEKGFTPLLASEREIFRGEYAAGLNLRSDRYTFPLAKPGRTKVSSSFGPRLHPILKRAKFHKGWDLPQRRGTPVLSSRTGRVVFSGWRGGYGQVVEVRHADGQRTVYGHLSQRLVKKGDWVGGGKTILGKVGSSGRATGAHLHFEVRDRWGRPLDPRSMLAFR